MSTLTIKNLKVEIAGKPILHGINLTVRKGETHCVMGPNGSGKSTLGNTLLAHPACTITNGSITFGKHILSQMKTDEIARAGVMIALQNPQTVSGVTVANLLTLARRKFEKNPKNFKPAYFREEIKDTAKALKMPSEFLSRSLNEGFSGGEKKKMEMLQIALLPAKCVVIDEIDSGLDIDALKLVARQISKLRERGTSVIIVTHYNRILRWVETDRVHIMHNGKLVKSGFRKLAEDIEKNGYGEYVAA